MAVKIRLKRLGKKKQPVYRVVVSDARTARDGNYIDAIGFYDPRQDPSVIEIENDKAVDWLGKGAQPTDAARKLLEISGAWTQFRIAKGEVHTVGAAAPATAPVDVAEAAEVEAAEVEAAEEPAADEAAAEPEAAVEEPNPDLAAADAEPGDASEDSPESPDSPDDEEE